MYMIVCINRYSQIWAKIHNYVVTKCTWGNWGVSMVVSPQASPVGPSDSSQPPAQENRWTGPKYRSWLLWLTMMIQPLKIIGEFWRKWGNTRANDWKLLMNNLQLITMENLVKWILMISNVDTINSSISITNESLVNAEQNGEIMANHWTSLI